MLQVLRQRFLYIILTIRGAYDGELSVNYRVRAVELESRGVLITVDLELNLVKFFVQQCPMKIRTNWDCPTPHRFHKSNW
jgi:hypothetical protein